MQMNTSTIDTSSVFASSLNPCIVLFLKSANNSKQSTTDDIILELPSDNTPWLTCHLIALNSFAREDLQLAPRHDEHIVSQDIAAVKRILNELIKPSSLAFKGLSDAALAVASPSVPDAREVKAEIIIPGIKGWPGSTMQQTIRITSLVVRDMQSLLAFIPILKLEFLSIQDGYESLTSQRDVSIRSAVRLSSDAQRNSAYRGEQRSLLRAGAMISAIPCIATLMELHPCDQDPSCPPGQLLYGRILMQNELSLAYWGKLDRTDRDGSWLMVQNLFGSSMEVVPDMIRQLNEQRRQKQNRPDDIIISLWKRVVKVSQRMERAQESCTPSSHKYSISLRLHMQDLPATSAPQVPVDAESDRASDSPGLFLVSNQASKSRALAILEKEEEARLPDDPQAWPSTSPLVSSEAVESSGSFARVILEANRSYEPGTGGGRKGGTRDKNTPRASTLSASATLPTVGMTVQPSRQLMSILAAIHTVASPSSGNKASSDRAKSNDKPAEDESEVDVEYSGGAVFDAAGRLHDKSGVFDVSQVPITMDLEGDEPLADNRKQGAGMHEVSSSPLTRKSMKTSAGLTSQGIASFARVSKLLPTGAPNKTTTFNDHPDQASNVKAVPIQAPETAEVTAIKRIGSGVSRKASNVSKVGSSQALGQRHSLCLSDLDISNETPVTLEGELIGDLYASTDNREMIWHEVQAVPVQDPVTGKDAILLLQTDITSRAIMEQRMAALTESQLSMLEDMFPRHVLEFIMGAAPPEATLGDLAYQHDDVTILFMDIVGFTSMSKEVPAQMVMEFLNNLFGKFDLLLDKYDVYKVETAGDCYIVAGALMVADEEGFMVLDREGDARDGARSVVLFAQAMLSHARTINMPHNGLPTCVRVGVHTGSVVSGLIGSKLPKFSLFGDTMNTSSRMETTSRPGCIQVSETTYAMLDQDHKSLFEATGGVEVKGKGIMPTYIYEPSEEELSMLAMPVAIGPSQTEPAETALSQPILASFQDWSKSPETNGAALSHLLSPRYHRFPQVFPSQRSATTITSIMEEDDIDNPSPSSLAFPFSGNIGVRQLNAEAEVFPRGSTTTNESIEDNKPSSKIGLGRRRVIRNASFRMPLATTPPARGCGSVSGSSGDLVSHPDFSSKSRSMTSSLVSPSGPRLLSKIQSMPKSSKCFEDAVKEAVMHSCLGQPTKHPQHSPGHSSSQISDQATRNAHAFIRSSDKESDPPPMLVNQSSTRAGPVFSRTSVVDPLSRQSPGQSPPMWSMVAHRLHTIASKVTMGTKKRRSSVIDVPGAGHMMLGEADASLLYQGLLDGRGSGYGTSRGSHKDLGPPPVLRTPGSRRKSILNIGLQMREVALASASGSRRS